VWLKSPEELLGKNWRYPFGVKARVFSFGAGLVAVVVPRNLQRAYQPQLREFPARGKSTGI